MSNGLYSREVIAAFFGKKPEDIDRMIEDDGLPAVPVPAGKRIRHKFSASQICAWLNKRSKLRWTVEDVIAELDRCVPQQGKAEIAAKLGKVNELRALCEAAERALSSGMNCPRVVGAIVQVAEELKTEGCAA